MPVHPVDFIIGARRATVAIALVLVCLPGAGRCEEEVVGGDLGGRLDRYLDRLTGCGFSGAAIVAVDGDVILHKGYGLADREAERPVTCETVFTVGSITKQFTGAAILKLEMQGKLSVDDRLARYIDDVPADKATITLHQLLTHTAGMPGSLGHDFDPTADRNAFLKLALGCDLVGEPGGQHEYSNVGYSLLGIVVEIVSGESYESYLRRELFLPAGMIDTGYLLPRFAKNRLAVGYRDGERWGSVIEQPMLADGPCWHLRANGGIHATVGDMLRWHRALAGERVLSPAAKEKYFHPHVDEGFGDSWYGYGWAVFETARDTRLVAHNGGNGIFSADMRRYVDEDVMFCLFSNLAEFAPVDLVSEQLAGIIFGGEVTWPPATVAMTPQQLGELTGTYKLDTSSIEVTAGRNRLLVTGRGDLAQKWLTGTALRTDDRRRERTRQLVAGWMEGDVEPIWQAFGGKVAREDLAGNCSDARQRWQSRYGDFIGLGKPTQRGAGETARTCIRLEFATGGLYMVFDWMEDELAGLGLDEQPPWQQLATATLFPHSATTFVSFNLRSPLHLEASFGGAARRPQTLTFTTDDGEKTAVRQE